MPGGTPQKQEDRAASYEYRRELGAPGVVARQTTILQ